MVQMKQFGSTEEWLQNRKLIGGSDASALVGMSPYKDNITLWKEKTGRQKPPDISDLPYVQFGHDAEPHLRALFALDHPEYEVGYAENNLWTNSKFPFAHASLDGWLTEKETGRRGVLEIKTTAIMQSAQWEQWDGRLPNQYFCQVLWYLMVTEFDFAVLKARIKSEWRGVPKISIRHYTIERSEVMEDIKILRRAGEKFWKAVQEDREPYLILPAI